MGLFPMADLLSRNGHETQILHLGIERITSKSFSIQAYIKETRPQIIGLSMHWHHQCQDILKTAEAIKSVDPEIKVILGGFTASFYYKEIMQRYKCVDALIRGEGEIPILQYVEQIINKKTHLGHIPNLCWRDKGHIINNALTYVATSSDLEQLCFTNLKLLRNYRFFVNYVKNPWYWITGLPYKINSLLLNKKKTVFSLTIFRGCQANCSYCGGGQEAQKLIMGRDRVAFRSIDSVIDSIKEAISYQYNTFYFEYLDHEKNPEYFNRLFEQISHNKLKINCILGCRTLPSKKFIANFKKAVYNINHSCIHLSPDSGSEEIRKLNKGYYYSNDELKEVLRFLEAEEVPCEIYFTIGLPYETLKDIESTRKLQCELNATFRKHVSIQTSSIEIEPGAPLFLYPDKYKIRKHDDSFGYYFLGDNDGFLFNRIGYCHVNAPTKTSATARLDISLFERQIGKIKCNYFCRLKLFILNKFFTNNKNASLEALISVFARFSCALISACWRFLNRGATRPY